MKFIAALFLTFVFISYTAHAKVTRVLFIGNSYIYYNDLPNMFTEVALSVGDTVYADSYAQGGYTFQMHSNDAACIAKIAQGNWDYVILQAQSQEPSFSPAQVQSDTYPYAKKLDSLINAYNPCAETLYFMTWGRKNGDASNCPFYPPVCTYLGMQQRLRESYLLFAQDNHASCAPVGMAWLRVRDSLPLTELYNPDESHPSLQGTYLSACVFYTSIFHKMPLSQYLPAGIGNSEALAMQNFASKTVLDSLENWQQYGDIPFASFSYNNTGNQFTFSNNSKRFTNVKWYFGDGDSSTLNNPTHTYNGTGNYQVLLVVDNNCKSSSDTLTLSVGPSGFQAVQTTSLFSYNSQYLFVDNRIANNKLQILNLQGQVVHEYNLSMGKSQVAHDLAPGNYIVQLKGIKNQKISIR